MPWSAWKTGRHGGISQQHWVSNFCGLNSSSACSTRAKEDVVNHRGPCDGLLCLAALSFELNAGRDVLACFCTRVPT